MKDHLKRRKNVMMFLLPTVAILLSACGGGGEGTDQEGQSAAQSNSGQYADCTGSYALKKSEGDICGSMRIPNMIDISQENNIIKMTSVDNGSEVCGVVRDVTAEVGTMLITYRGRIMWYGMYEDPIYCFYSIYVGHAMTRYCIDEHSYLFDDSGYCTVWYRYEKNDSTGSNYDPNQYPRLVRYNEGGYWDIEGDGECVTE